jgi:hypothetical protein
MCPACLTTVALIAAGASSTGGFTALVVRTLRSKSGGRDEADLPSPSASDDATLQETAR